MMRKKQIFRMLVGALAVCLAAACSNETDVLNGFPTDGNTISVNLRTNDIGAATRAIATNDESKVESLSAYLFDEQEDGSYALEKVYSNLPWSSSDETHSVALTGIKERGPKKVYFVANGTSIEALKNVSAELSEADFQALLMDKMLANPSTPLPMTAQAELAEWGEEVNNASIQEAVQLKRVSARIDLTVDTQEGLSFELTSIALSAAAGSYIFPNEEGAYSGSEETIEISGTTLYPYEAAAGTVKEVKVTGNVTVGNIKKEATFAVPFVNDEYADGIAIERNHRYTVHISHINGFYSVEATVTVSDWSTANLSGDLQAGEELKMTATEFANGAPGNAPAATAVYPAEGGTTSATVALTAEDAKVYKIWVGSANIEAVTSWGELPNGWTMAEPISTRAEYLWEKSYWTLTIPANESQKAKSLTIKSVNKLELAKNENTEKYVEITFTQEGKEEEDTGNPGDMDNWGGGENPQGPTCSESDITGRTTSGWCVNGRFMYPTQNFGKAVTYTNGIKNTINTLAYSKGNNFTKYAGTGSVLCSNSNILDAIYYQWGRSMGFPSTVETIIVDPAWGYQVNSYLSSGNAMSANWLNIVSNYTDKYGYNNTSYGYQTIWNAFYAAVPNTTGYPINTVAKINDFGIIFFEGKRDGNRDYYTGSGALSTLEARGGDPCPEGYRMPTAKELEVLIPSGGKFTSSHSEIKEVNGSCYAMQWIVTPYNNKKLPYVTIKSVKVNAGTNLAGVDFSKASSINLGALGYINNAGTFTISSSGYYMGLYWSSDYVSSSGRIKYLEIDIQNSKVEMSISDNGSPSWGACVLPIKDEKATGKGSIITPLLPLYQI